MRAMASNRSGGYRPTLASSADGTCFARDLAISTFRKGIWEDHLIFEKTRDDYLAWATAERDKAK